MGPGAEPRLRLEGARASAGRPDRARRVAAARTALLMVLVAVLSGAHVRRPPFPGESFRPEDLTAPWWRYGSWLLLFAVLASLVHWAWSAYRARPEALPGAPTGPVEVHADRVVVPISGASRAIPLFLVEHVEHEPHGERERGTVTLRLCGGEVVSVEAGKAGAPRLFAALRAARGKRTARLPIGSVLAAFTFGRGLGWTALALSFSVFLAQLGNLSERLLHGKGQGNSLALGIAGGLTALWVLVLARREVVVGTDGVRVEGMLSSRFFSFARARGVRFWNGGLVVLERKGALDLRLPRAPGGEALFDRVSAAFEAQRAAGDEELSALDRGDEPVATWGARLRALRQDRRYRVAPVADEALRRTLEDPRTDPARRVAAALALGGDEEGRARVRLAAEASADPAMRSALEAASEAELEEAALERAIERARRRA